MTEETKREILRDYENKNIKVEEIAEKYGIGRAAVAKIAVEMGGQPRCAIKYGKRKGKKNKICPKCKKLIEVQGAKFCCFCGATEGATPTDLRAANANPRVLAHKLISKNRDSVTIRPSASLIFEKSKIFPLFFYPSVRSFEKVIENGKFSSLTM